MASLFEKVRPRTWDDVVGQPKAVAMLRRLTAAGNAFWFSGASGTGKTTMARIKAAEFAESWNVEEVDALDVGIDFVRQMEVAFAYKGMGEKTGKVWIINEAQGMSDKVQSRFLTLLEAMPEHCCVMFTTTEGTYLFPSPLMSRCKKVPMEVHSTGFPNRAMIAAFAGRALTVARAEGLDGKPLAAYEQLAMRTDVAGNFRAMLSAIESGEMMP